MATPDNQPNSWRASKKLFFKRLYKDIGSLGDIDSLADYGCGTMNLRDHVKIRKYFAVDISQEALDAGLAKHPDAITFCKRLQDVSLPEKVDVAVCVETLGINVLFEVDEIVESIEKIIGSINKGGTLFINIGPTIILDNPPLYERVCKILSSEFKQISKMEYGRFNDRSIYWKSRLSYNLLVIFPFLKKNSKKPYHYFACYEKAN